MPLSSGDVLMLNSVTVNLVFQGFFCMYVHTLAFKKVITTNVIDKLGGVRFYSFSATTDNEVLSTPFYYSNPKLYTVIGS